MRDSRRDAAADVLRGWALDEDLKERVMSSPPLAAVARRIAERYTAGETVGDAIAAAKRSVARGHLVSLEYAGESVRDAHVAKAETGVFLDLIGELRQAGIPSTVSFDLSHIGSLVSPSLALENARLMADALAPLGTGLMISAEGSDRTDLVLDLPRGSQYKRHPCRYHPAGAAAPERKGSWAFAGAGPSPEPAGAHQIGEGGVP